MIRASAGYSAAAKPILTRPSIGCTSSASTSHSREWICQESGWHENSPWQNHKHCRHVVRYESAGPGKAQHPAALDAVALEVSCMLGLVRLGFAATVYQVILRLPDTENLRCRLALFLVSSLVCVPPVLDVVKTGFAAAVYPADAQARS